VASLPWQLMMAGESLLDRSKATLLNVTFSERTARPFSVRRLHAAAVSLPRIGVAGCAS
jgi:hypothetical protein